MHRLPSFPWGTLLDPWVGHRDIFNSLSWMPVSKSFYYSTTIHRHILSLLNCREIRIKKKRSLLRRVSDFITFLRKVMLALSAPNSINFPLWKERKTLPKSYIKVATWNWIWTPWDWGNISTANVKSKIAFIKRNDFAIFAITQLLDLYIFMFKSSNLFDILHIIIFLQLKIKINFELHPIYPSFSFFVFWSVIFSCKDIFSWVLNGFKIGG